MKRGLFFATLVTLGIVFIGCGGGGGGSSTSSGASTKQTTTTTTDATNTTTTTGTTTPKETIESANVGYYVDAPIMGVAYKCGTKEGITDTQGRFYFQTDKACSFYLGNLLLRTLEAKQLKKGVIVFEDNPKVARLLQTLNTSKESATLSVDALAVRALGEEKFQQTSIQNEQTEVLVAKIEDTIEQYGVVKDYKIASTTQVEEHLRQSYKNYCGSKEFLAMENAAEKFGTCTTKPQTTNPTTPTTPNKNSADTNTTESDNNTTQTDTTPKETPVKKAYSEYIPQGDELSVAMAHKFLNMATFGATQELIKELQSKGVEKWVDVQLNMAYDEKKESILYGVLKTLLKTDAEYYGYDDTTTPEDIIGKKTKKLFNVGKRNGPNELQHHSAQLFTRQVLDKAQLRQRVAYALSQIIVASESNDLFFYDKGEALSYYYDILLKNAFGNYGDILYDVSFSPAMGIFLTFVNNRKAYADAKTKTTILPDENYGREIMQLFSIGLYELNMDGTQKRVDGKRVSTYEQKDVNNMSRVFTGLGYENRLLGSESLWGDMIHPLKCTQNFHDEEAKEILGETLPAGQSCQEDIKSAIDLLMSHPNVAPFVAKKLIMRLTKSNPKPDYIQRVAEVFKDTHGDLKATIKAILLDEEIWEDIKADNGVKIKEPYMAFTALLRSVGLKALPYMKFNPWRKKDVIQVDNAGIYLGERGGYQIGSLYNTLGQWPTFSPSVFNYYEDDFTPDDYEFKVRGFVAPELEIVTAKYVVNTYSYLKTLLQQNALQYYDLDPSKDQVEEYMAKWRYDGFYGYIDYSDLVEIFAKGGAGESLKEVSSDAKEKKAFFDKVIPQILDAVSIKLTGKVLPQKQREEMIAYYETFNNKYSSRKNTAEIRKNYLLRYLFVPMMLDIYQSDAFNVE